MFPARFQGSCCFKVPSLVDLSELNQPTLPKSYASMYNLYSVCTDEDFSSFDRVRNAFLFSRKLTSIFGALWKLTRGRQLWWYR